MLVNPSTPPRVGVTRADASSGSIERRRAAEASLRSAMGRNTPPSASVSFASRVSLVHHPLFAAQGLALSGSGIAVDRTKIGSLGEPTIDDPAAAIAALARQSDAAGTPHAARISGSTPQLSAATRSRPSCRPMLGMNPDAGAASAQPVTDRCDQAGERCFDASSQRQCPDASALICHDR